MKVAVLGYGTVGYGVYEMLKKAPGFEAGPVLVRPGKADADFKVSSIEDIINDETIDAVAEVMGGIEPAYSYAAKVLASGKHFVTSNKALVAAKGIELAAIAEAHGCAFLFSAACGGAVPFLHNIALAAESDSILSLSGILNGTTNFMLDGMQSEGADYPEILKKAQELGYAEADPTADVSGLDALRKIMLACAVAYGKLPVEGLAHEGIESITAEDVKQFQSMGLTCRLIVSGGPAGESVYANVEPVLFKADAPECSVKKNFNMAKYVGENSGLIVYMGQGAGRYPTASAVLRDLSDIAHGKRTMMSPGVKAVKADNSSCCHRYYVRCAADIAGSFEFDECIPCGDTAVIITAPLSVDKMHSKAAEIRAAGGSIFFAAIGE